MGHYHQALADLEMRLGKNLTNVNKILDKKLPNGKERKYNQRGSWPISIFRTITLCKCISIENHIPTMGEREVHRNSLCNDQRYSHGHHAWIVTHDITWSHDYHFVLDIGEIVIKP